MTSVPIVHVDLDAFFASVEIRLRPPLRNRPVVIAFDGARSVVSTANYPARQYGIRSAMPLMQARRLCRDLLVVEPRMAAYQAVSDLVMGALAERSHVVESGGLDEAYLLPRLDTGTEPTQLRLWAEELRADIRRIVGIPLSVGIGSTKVVAKIASDRAKPDGVLVVDPADENDFLANQPIRALPGVGPVTEKVFQDRGMLTVGDIRTRTRAQLVTLLGMTGGTLWDLARNTDGRPVSENGPSSQISVERTYEEDLQPDEVPAAFAALAAELSQRLTDSTKSGSTITMKLRRPDLSSVTRSTTLTSPVRSRGDLARLGDHLYQRAGWTGPVRLLGLGVSALTTTEQLDFELLPTRSDTESVDRETQPNDRESNSPTSIRRSQQPSAQLLERIHWGMRLQHPTFGIGRVEGLDGTVIAIRFAQTLRLIDLQHVDLQHVDFKHVELQHVDR
jgi:DNA polymerase-4